MNSVTLQAVGRVLVVRYSSIIDGKSVPTEDIIDSLHARRARFVVIDAMQSPHADTDGIRWLLRFRTYRVAAAPNGKLWRTLQFLQLDRNVFGAVRAAWQTPWSIKHCP